MRSNLPILVRIYELRQFRKKGEQNTDHKKKSQKKQAKNHNRKTDRARAKPRTAVRHTRRQIAGETGRDEARSETRGERLAQAEFTAMIGVSQAPSPRASSVGKLYQH